jgi:hypothetical protein
MDTTVLCQNQIIQPDNYGGTPCPAPVVSSHCLKECPGCRYSNPADCGCDITSSIVIKNNPQTYFGTQTCVYEAETTFTQVVRGIENYAGAPQMCENTIQKYPDYQCSTTIAPGDCYFSKYTCFDCKNFETIYEEGSYYARGTRSCILTDFRNTDAPAAWYNDRESFFFLQIVLFSFCN